MRIKEELKKSGYFWLPSNPEKKLPGTLLINNGGSIQLELVGLFDESIEGLNRAANVQENLRRINGNVEKLGLVTLDDCFYTERNISFGGISKSLIFVRRAFVGVVYDENEIPTFNTFRFSIEGIDEWVGINGFKTNYEYENKTALITYIAPEEISLKINNGMKLLINFDWTLSDGLNIKEAKITQKTYFELDSSQERPLNEFIEIVQKIVTFLGFAVDKTVCIEMIQATSNSIKHITTSGKTVPVGISFYYRSLPYVEKKAEIKKTQMLFGFWQIQHCAERIFNNWFEAYEEFEPALNLYFSTQMDAHKFVESKFLSLAQGLETYHRKTTKERLMDEVIFNDLVKELIELCPGEHNKWLEGRLRHGNEVTLSRRLKSIIEPFKDLLGSSAERSKLVKTIVDTRNYLTHYEKSSDSIILQSGGDLLMLCLKMEGIFQLHLLQKLGFIHKEIMSVYENSNLLRRKLNPPRLEL